MTLSHDHHAETKLIHAVGPAALVANTVITPLDTNGFESAEWLIHVGVAFAGGGFDVTLQEDADDGSGSPVGSPSAVSADETRGSLPSIAIADASKTFRVGTVGKERHQGLTLTMTDTITAGIIGVTLLLSNPHKVPVADQST